MDLLQWIYHYHEENSVTKFTRHHLIIATFPMFLPLHSRNPGQSDVFGMWRHDALEAVSADTSTAMDGFGSVQQASPVAGKERWNMGAA